MSSANQLVAKIRTDLEPLERKIVGHPYLSTIEEGRVPRDLFNLFAGQQHHIIISDLRSIALIISRHGMFPGRRFLMNVLQGEAAALDGLHTFAGALGLSVIDLEAFEPLPAAHAYCGFVAWLALYGSDAELAGAFLVNFAAWGTNCERISRALREKYGFAESDLVFFGLFSSPPSFERDALSVIQDGLDRGIPARLIHRAARMLQGYELMYWDAMAEAGGIRIDRGE
jgi:thiaminase